MTVGDKVLAHENDDFFSEKITYVSSFTMQGKYHVILNIYIDVI